MLATALGVMLLVSWSAHEQPDREDYVIYLANRKPDALAAEAEQSCGATCTHPIAGLAVSPPQEPFWFEGHDPNSGAGIGGGLTQQLHPARAVLEILNSGEPMSMMAVDIGAAGGNPECAPLFNGTLGHSWGGAQVDPRSITKISEKVRFIQAKAEPPTIAKHLQGACMPKDLDLLKIDIDCYDWDVAKALLEAGFRPKVFAAEITIAFPPPLHFHISYWPGYQWVQLSKRDPNQQVLVGASLSACALSTPLPQSLLRASDDVMLTRVQLLRRLGSTEATGLHPPCCRLLQLCVRTDEIHPPLW